MGFFACTIFRGLIVCQIFLTKKIKVNKIIGHLPSETSRPAKILTDRGILERHCVKSVRIGSFYAPYFPAFGLNTERNSVSLRIQYECGKIRTRQTPNTDTFYEVRYCEKVHELYEEPEEDIVVGTFDNTEDIELEPRQKKKQMDTPKTNKKKLPGCQG